MTGLNRAGFYRWRTPRQATPVEMELRDQMREVALEPAAYGYRRITSVLQKRGFAVKHQFGHQPFAPALVGHKTRPRTSANTGWPATARRLASMLGGVPKYPP
jgi:hypothetical protein